ncbi:MAG: DUF1957 domain-containing protein, partial [Clostridia bacterium]|nr:DUF1957 domain-containing protein [Clostridia bacterium]
MPQGYVALVLHAHLPYVRHPELSYSLEEKWLFEGITETYIPLIATLQSLVRDNVDFALTISLSPTLISMLEDEFLQNRYLNHLKLLMELADKEVERTSNQPAFHHLAQMYRRIYYEAYDLYYRRYRGRLMLAFQELDRSGKVEFITCASTHGYLPLLDIHREVLRAQVQVAVELFRRYFGRHPQGFWLPECGYAPGDDEILAEYGIKYFIVDTHG